MKTCRLTFLEESKRSLIGLIPLASKRTLELHKTTVGIAVDAAGELEPGDFHLPVVDELVDLAANSIASFRNGAVRLIAIVVRVQRISYSGERTLARRIRFMKVL